MGVSIRVNKGIVYLVMYDNGERHEESTGLHVTADKNQNKEIMKFAEILRSKKEIELLKENMEGGKKSKLTLYDYMEDFSEDKSHSTSNMKRVLPFIEKFGGKDILLHEITPAWFENFQTRMQFDSGLGSAHSQEKYCQFVRQALKKAARDGLIVRDPSTGIKHLSLPDSKKEFLTADEVRAMVKTEYANKMAPELQSDIRRAFIFGCLTGFRISDLKQLSWGDIDVKNKIVIKQQKKTKRIVSVPLSEEAWIIIYDGESHDPDEKVFKYLGPAGSSTNRFIHAWAEASGIHKNVSWHTARHTDATLLLENGADLYTVQRLLGHTKIQTTMQYAVVSDKKKKEAVSSLPSIGISQDTLG